MKVVKLIFGVLFGLYAAGQGIQFLMSMVAGRYISVTLASLGAMCFGAAISVVLFRSALNPERIKNRSK